MKAEGVFEKVKTLNFAQTFLAFITLVQLFAVVASFFIRLFAEFGLIKVSFSLYIIFMIFCIVLMVLFLSTIRGKSGSYLLVTLIYFVFSVTIMAFVNQIESGIFSMFEIGTSIFVAWGSMNLFLSMLMLMVALVRLIALGLGRDYQKVSQSSMADTSVNDLKNEVADLRRKLNEFKKQGEHNP